jgi:hypothetical protein
LLRKDIAPDRISPPVIRPEHPHKIDTNLKSQGAATVPQPTRSIQGNIFSGPPNPLSPSLMLGHDHRDIAPFN